METRHLSMVVLFILLTSSITAATPFSQTETHMLFERFIKNTIYVDDDNSQGPWDGSSEHPYQHISDGMLHAQNGSTVFVFSGLYPETLLINTSITLQGEQQNTTLIDGQNNGSVITVVSDDVNINGFTIRNSGGDHDNAGVQVNAQAISITSCTIYRARNGILVQNKKEVIITSCRFHTNGYGILVSSSLFATIDSCVFYHNGIGAWFLETDMIRITNSYTDSNGIGFLFEGSSNIRISKSAARDNDDNEGGMFFEHCQVIDVSNCYLVHNGVGINLDTSSDCTISQCNFSFNTHFSCRIKHSHSRIKITQCIFTHNLRYGLHAENSSFVVIFTNFYRNANYGLYATSSIIDARENWWGSKNGPARTGLTKADRGTWSLHEITYEPWRSSPVENSGPDWSLDATFEKPSYSNPWPEHITLQDSDTDGDRVPDWWEIKWGYDPAAWDDHLHLDPDKDALNNVEEWFMDGSGSNPFKKDVFLEFDWTTSIVAGTTNKPAAQEVAQMIDAFAAQNITLHVDTGELGGGEEIPPMAFVSYADIVAIYWDYFLHHDLDNPRQRIFHYGIICDYSEGPGFAVIGWDHLNSFVISAQFLIEKFKPYSRDWYSVTSAMHELGHTFGLIVTKYDGIDNQGSIKPIYKQFWKYRHYKSMMNYFYTYLRMDFSDGSHGLGDYNDWGNLDFSFFKNSTFKYPLS